MAGGGDFVEAKGGESSWLGMVGGGEHSCPRGDQARETVRQGFGIRLKVAGGDTIRTHVGG